MPGGIILPKGSVVQGRYIVEDLLGRGGFGAVYLVRDQRTKGNVFALKEIINPGQRERDRFIFECEVLKRLDHPALPHVYSVFQDQRNNRAYMLMDYIEGPNLERLRQQQPERRFTLPRAITIMASIVDVIAYLHSQQPPIIHRDIKPSNIIVPTSGDRPVLVDFGIAKEYDPDTTTAAVRRCSPGFSAPEQYTHGTDIRTDIYALGAVFYTLLTGVLPVDALRRLTYLGSRDADPLKPVSQFVPTLPAPVGEAIHRALALNSDERFANVEEFWQAISVYSSGEPLPESVVGQVAPLSTIVAAPSVSFYRQRQRSRSRKRRPFAFFLIGGASLALLAGFAFRAHFWPMGGLSGLSVPTATPQATCKVATRSTTLPTHVSASPMVTSPSACEIAAITPTMVPRAPVGSTATVEATATVEPMVTMGPMTTYPAVTPTPTAIPTPTPIATPTPTPTLIATLRPTSSPRSASTISLSSSISSSSTSPSLSPGLLSQQNCNGQQTSTKHRGSKKHKHRKGHGND